MNITRKSRILEKLASKRSITDKVLGFFGRGSKKVEAANPQNPQGLYLREPLPRLRGSEEQFTRAIKRIQESPRPLTPRARDYIQDGRITSKIRRIKRKAAKDKKNVPEGRRQRRLRGDIDANMWAETDRLKSIPKRYKYDRSSWNLSGFKERGQNPRNPDPSDPLTFARDMGY